VPLSSRSIAGVSYIPLGLLVQLVFYGFILRRAAHDYRCRHARLAQA
jgi:hypothetical protein